ncbi:MAG TPA: antitoxin VapB family protein [Candidatus Pacearchaeota archaeon]|nr:antitoxin VapB family protein [Candidatus Pacearchaeota archaeon]
MVTTIQLDEKVKDKLDKIKIHYRESYNDVIIRILNNCSPKNVDRESLIETIEILSDSQTMRDIAQSLEEYEKGRGIEFSKLKKELNLDV